jgi:hypothetical protein
LDRTTLKTLVIEVFSVVFAVLLALGLNNWWKEKSNERLGREALANIVMEMKNNMTDLDSAVVHLQIQLDSLILQEENYKNGIDSSLSFGYSQSLLSTTAWQTANITQAVLHIDPEIIMEIASLYEVQKVYADFGTQYFKQYSSLEFNKKENRLNALRSNINQIKISLSISRQLREDYDNFFEEYGDRLPSHP